MEKHSPVLPRQPPGKGSPTEEFLSLLQDPFGSQILTKALWTSLITSLGTTLVLALLFSVLRPHYTTVYAPRLRRAIGDRAPPPVGKGLLAWITPVRKTREAQLAATVGLDAVIFLRFSRMCRNMFLVMSLLGLGVLIPANVTGSVKSLTTELRGLMQMSPLVVFGRPLWAQVVCAWVFDLIIIAFLYRNYVVVRRLRRAYFESARYQSHLHSRTLMALAIPPKLRSDAGVYQICSTIQGASSSVPHTVIGRDVKGLRKLIKEHEKAVLKLESYLVKYLKKPDKLPAVRPKCKPMKGDTDYSRSQKVDAIDYLQDRMRRLEERIKEMRRNPEASAAMSYGFSCYDTVEEAHAVAYRARRKRPKGVVVRLAPPPNDIIWTNLPLSKAARRWRTFINRLWVALLTVIWIVPNAMIAIFLTNLPNLGKVWPAFQKQLYAHPSTWAAVQGIASPAILSLFYILLPILFRRLANHAGDTTKTSRERHVLHQLYAFFVFNNLIVFTTFSAVWQFITVVIKAKEDNHNVWNDIKAFDLWTKVLAALCQVSPFWVTWLLQRNLGAAVDLAQVANLFWIWFAKTALSHTPRQREWWMSPPVFDYASYYNYFLFYATVALCFATLQPIILPVAALYFTVDSWLKKYLLMYVFVTKNESGGQFWRVVYNRMVFAAILANAVVISVVSARKEWTMAIAMSPGPLVMILFKLYCRRAFDNDIHYYRRNLTDTEALPPPVKPTKIRQAELERKFDNPVFYHQLIGPMVWKEAEKALQALLKTRTYSDAGNVTGYDGILLDPMSEGQPGKTSQDASNNGSNTTSFRFVSESVVGAPEPYMFGIDEDARDDLISERPFTPASNMSNNGPYITPPYSRAASPARSLHDRRNAPYQSHRYRSQSPLSRSTTRTTTTGYPPPGPPRPPRPRPPPPPPLPRGGEYDDLDAAGPTMPTAAAMMYAHPDESESQSELLRAAATMPTSSSTYHSHHHQHHPYPLQREHSSDSAASVYTTNSSYEDFRPARR